MALANVPSFSVTPTAGQQMSEAIEKGPQNVATDKAVTEQAKNATAQAQLGEQNANDQLLQRIVAPAVTNPEVAQSPQWQKLVSDKLATTGLQLPKGEDGQIDIKALSAMVSPVIKKDIDPEGATKLLQVPPGPARNALASLYNPASISAEMMSGQMIPSQETINTAQKGFNQQLLLTQEGKVSPSAFMAGLNKDMLPYFGQSWANINHDPALLGGMTSLMKANLDKMVSAGLLSRASADLKEAEVAKQPSIEAMNLAHAKYFGQEGASADTRAQAAVTNANAHATQASAYTKEVNQRISDSDHGSWTARQQLVQKDLAEVVKQRTNADVDVRQISAQIAIAKNAGTDITASLGVDSEGKPLPSLLDSLTAAQASRRAFDQTLQAIKSPSLAANAAKGQLNAIGGAGVQNKPENSDIHGTVVDTRVDAQGKKWNKYSDGSISAAQ